MLYSTWQTCEDDLVIIVSSLMALRRYLHSDNIQMLRQLQIKRCLYSRQMSEQFSSSQSLHSVSNQLNTLPQGNVENELRSTGSGSLRVLRGFKHKDSLFPERYIYILETKSYGERYTCPVLEYVSHHRWALPNVPLPAQQNYTKPHSEKWRKRPEKER